MFTKQLLFYLGLAICIPSYSQTFLRNFQTVGEILPVGEIVYFTADDLSEPGTLWKTDGTPHGTELVYDFRLDGFFSSTPWISELTELNGNIFFSAWHPILGHELWISDGTPEGTQLVKDINASDGGDNGSYPRNLTVHDGYLYFSAESETQKGLWRSDGTAAGTDLVFDSNYGVIYGFRLIEDRILFRRYTGELYLYNTQTGVTKEVLRDELSGTKLLSAYNGVGYFIRSSSSLLRLYTLDPADTIPELVYEFSTPQYGSTELDNLTAVGSTIFFSLRTYDGNNTYRDELWATDGTNSGTSLVQSFNWDRYQSESYIKHFTDFNGKLLFQAPYRDGGSIWVSGGTEATTHEWVSKRMGNEVKPIVSGELLFFVSDDYKLWTTNGTEEGTTIYSRQELIHGNIAGMEPAILTPFRDHLYYSAWDDDKEVAVWNSFEDSEISVFINNDEYLQGEAVTFESQIGDCQEQVFNIRNDGNAPLAFSNVEVTGTAFYLSGELPSFLSPGDTAQFSVHYFPYSYSAPKSQLLIRNNDRNEAVFRLSLSGFIPSSNPSETFSSPKELVKILKPRDNEYKIELEGGTVSENQPVFTTVGSLSVQGESASFGYTLVQGEGDRDNDLFIIEGNLLKTNTSLDFESNSTLSIRVRATGSHNSFEVPLVVQVVNVNEPVVYENCEGSATNLAYSINDVEFLDEHTLVAVGTSGTVVISTDGGVQWERWNIGFDGDFLDIESVGNNELYLLAEGNLLFKSEDNGESWYPLVFEDETYPFARKIYFISPQLGFIIGDGGKIYRTTNGGVTWRRSFKGWQNLLSIDFVNETIGFIAGESGKLYKTLNGGQSWEEIETGLDRSTISSILFETDQQGYFLTRKGEVYQSSNQGTTWNLLSSAPINHSTHLFFVSSNEAYLIGGDDYETLNLFKSLDGGQTWTDQSLATGNFLIAIAANPSGSKICVAGSSLSSAQPGSNLHLLGSGAWETLSNLAPVDFGSISAIGTNLYVFGERHFKSSDGGITWTEMSIVENALYSDRIKGSHFMDANHGLVTTTFSELYETEDGGDNWSIKDPNISGSFSDVYFFSNSLGFLYGEDSLFRTNDGGLTWTSCTTNTTSSFIRDVRMVNEDLGFAVSGNPANVLKTIDGGINWTPSNDYNYEILNTIQILDESTVLALGEDGFILRSTDNGTSWNEVPDPYSWDIKSAVFTSALEGYAAAARGGVIHTKNGGLNWRRMDFGSESYDIALFEDGFVTAGMDGSLFSFQPQGSPSLPGFISGRITVPVNTTLQYKVPANGNQQFSWSVEGPNALEYESNKASVAWTTPGNYQLTVTPYNSCGVGSIRTKNIHVISLPEPKITGDTSVHKGDKGIVYETAATDYHSYTWHVEGAESYLANGNRLTVDWGQHAIGHITVYETAIYTGARQKDVLAVTLTQRTNQAPIITGTVKNWSILQGSSAAIMLSDLIVEDPDNDFPNDHSLTIQPSSNYTIDGSTVTPIPSVLDEMVVKVTVSDGMDTSNEYGIPIEVRAPLEVPKSTVRALYPNPADSEVRIQLESQMYGTIRAIEICDLTGRIIRSVDLDTEIFAQPISIEGLSPGMYLVRIQFQNETSVHPLIKN